MSAAQPDTLAAPVTPLPPTACYEFVAYPLECPAIGSRYAWPTQAGAALRDAAGRPRLLHFAPQRWLAPEPDAALLEELRRLEREACGALVDVEGKWREVRLPQAHACRILSCSIDVAAVLADRDCAAVVLFDCPAILARQGGNYLLWIAASFIESFVAVSSALPIPRQGGL